MKRFYFLLIICLFSLSGQAQENDTYLPFVQKGKTWNMVRAPQIGPTATKVRFYFSNEEVQIGDQTYLTMYSEEESADSTIIKKIGLYREEGKTVYRYNEDTQSDEMYYDFSLKVGDTFTHKLHLGYTQNCKVIDEDELIVNGHHLRLLSIEATSAFGTLRIAWVEGVGSTNGFYCRDDYVSKYGDPFGPHEAFVDNSTITNVSYVLYGAESNYAFLPFNFVNMECGFQGQQLVCGDESEDGENNQLYCELIGEERPGAVSLHVKGYMYCQCGPNNYIYCKEIDSGNRNFYVSLEIEEAEPTTDCKGLYFVDLYFPIFYLGRPKYVEFQGERFPIFNHIGNYRHLISDQKVWKVGWFPDGGNVAQRLAYYYFDGDTIIGEQKAKRLMCRWEAAPDYAFADDSQTYTEYVAALYETDYCVLFALPNQKEFSLLYDFAAYTGMSFYVGDAITWNEPSEQSSNCTVIDKGVIDESCFKGNYMKVGFGKRIKNEGSYSDGEAIWYEGVGGLPMPLNNYPYIIPPCLCDYYHLFSCVDGEEIIYLDNEGKIDGVTPDDEEAKRRIDFTHTIKTQPKAPRRNATQETEELIFGEYSQNQLVVNLGQLKDDYTVSIVNPSGRIVYKKEVKAGSVLALNIDISEYTNSDYTITLENGNECFTGVFNPYNVVGIETITTNFPKNNEGSIYDLTGRRLNSVPEKGMYIQGGRKYLIKK